MPKQISIFNHRGGASKTSAIFNLGWMLATKNKKVLLADCDPQCNLTAMVLSYTGSDNLKTIYDRDGVTSIYEGLRPAFEAIPKIIEPVVCLEVPGNTNLSLLPGHIALSEFDIPLGAAQNFTDSFATLKNLPGSLRYLLNETAEKNEIDIVIVDMSPSLNAINHNLLMTSDYFIISFFPDIFTSMANKSLAKILPLWNSLAKKLATLPNLIHSSYPYQYNNLKFLGAIFQNYGTRSWNMPTNDNKQWNANIKQWIDELSSSIYQILIPAMSDSGMSLSYEKYKNNNAVPPSPLLQITNFTNLIKLSRHLRTPVYQLTDKQLKQTGTDLAKTKTSLEKFSLLFERGAEKILGLVS
ncbi:MAG: AAA family ATPase [Deltaproteobacteria bacterium]|jgi:cellulose biosynthesis protein BcsQ|nr:AAA family ATPase [Deltaproteobacteria bacterium]